MEKDETFGGKRNSNGFDKRPEDTTKGGRPISFRKALEDMLQLEGVLRITNARELKKKSNGAYIETGNQFEIAEITIPNRTKILLNALSRAATSKDWRTIYEIFEGRPTGRQEFRITADDFNLDLVPVLLYGITKEVFMIGSGRTKPDLERIKVALLIALKEVEDLINI